MDTLGRILRAASQYAERDPLDTTGLPVGQIDLSCTAASCARVVAHELHPDGGGESQVWIHLLNLLDNLVIAQAHQLPLLTHEVPQVVDDRRFDAYIAALVEHVCAQRRAPIPAWTSDQARFCLPWKPAPWQWGDNDEPLYQTPAAFLRHGVLLHPRELQRR